MAGKLSLTVSQLNEYIRRMLQIDPMLHNVELKGEISNLKFHQTGSVFFTLKDEQAAISCVMYATDALSLQAEPFEGMRAVVSGSVGLYVRGGQMQFYVRHMRADGVGVLYERLMALKASLSREGLFSAEKKKPLPAVPDTIGVVSSPTGAVIHDILNVSLRRDPQVRLLLCPVRVQGIGAAQEVAQALHVLDQMDNVSVIVVARGGGSMEDLWTFNEEEVVRAVASCRKPVVSAVGHETDVTLCDLAADLRAPTPSAAAECVVPLRSDLYARIENWQSGLQGAALMQLSRKQNALEMACIRLRSLEPKRRIGREEEKLALLQTALRQQMRARIQKSEMQIDRLSRELELMNPYRVLARGYAIAVKNGIPVRMASQLAAGDEVLLRFADGKVRARIETDGSQNNETTEKA